MTASRPKPRYWRWQRIVMAPPFAHALLVTLHRAVAEHEELHGPIEQG